MHCNFNFQMLATVIKAILHPSQIRFSTISQPVKKIGVHRKGISLADDNTMHTGFKSTEKQYN